MAKVKQKKKLTKKNFRKLKAPYGSKEHQEAVKSLWDWLRG